MNNLADYLGKKADSLDLSRGDDLIKVQKLLDSWYPGKCRAQKIHNSKLTITTTSSSVANDLRFKTHQLLEVATDATKVIIR